MSSTAINSQGSTLEVDDTIPGTADTAVINIKTFSGFDGEASEIDVTNLSSTAKEFRSGLQDFGSFSFEWHPDYTDPGQNAVRSAQASGEVKTLKLTLPNGDIADFSGLIKNASSITGGVDAVVDGSVSVKITGNVVITPSP